MVEFKQKRMANFTAFFFGESSLRYSIKDNSGERELTVEYVDLPSSSRRVFEKNSWLRNVGALWCVLGVVMMGLAFAGGERPAGGTLWLILGGGCLVAYRFLQTNYTVFDTSAGSVWVIEDKAHASILAEIASRRKGLLLARYGAVNLENDPEREIQKIEWLVKESVLDRDMADKQISAVRAAASGVIPPERRLN